jgi:Bax protein
MKQLYNMAMRNKILVCLVLLNSVTLFGKTAIKSDTIVYEIKSYQEGLDLMEKLNYTPESWQAGIREVPGLYIMQISEHWRNETTKEISVQLKKQIFFRVLAPLALYSNEVIMKERKRLEALIKNRSNWADEDSKWLVALANDYKLSASNKTDLTASLLAELLIRVDIIPVSLALTQSVEESGWGTSRFAAEGNALFGQWAWGKDAMKPKEQRSGMGDYGLAKFDTPVESMMAYMHNLNTHNAYKDLRIQRAEMRSNGGEPRGYELANSLIKYSERGQAYVNTLQSIMRVNHLQQTDEAYLNHDKVILLVSIDD